MGIVEVKNMGFTYGLDSCTTDAGTGQTPGCRMALCRVSLVVVVGFCMDCQCDFGRIAKAKVWNAKPRLPSKQRYTRYTDRLRKVLGQLVRGIVRDG